MNRRIMSVLIWSMIAAAFIGPGTLTTASAAGAEHEYALLWTLAFATFACIVLQEASARISIEKNRGLAEIISNRYSGKTLFVIKVMVGGSVVFGCAAYQGGNITGAISGLSLLTEVNKPVLVIATTVIIGILLFLGSTRGLATLLSIFVGLMGVCFIIAAFVSDHEITRIASGFVPSIPEGSGFLVLGLVGTTIVPYNLFLGPGISREQSLAEMRLGLVISVLLGGLISMAIVLTGSLVDGNFSFEALAGSLSGKMGKWAPIVLGGGLFAAGFTSSITSPLAAGYIVRGFSGIKNQTAFRVGWMFVLLVGLLIGLSSYKPIPVIITAQALNGLILPVIVVMIMVMVNDPRLLGPENINSPVQNLLITVVALVVVAIGANNFASALISAFQLNFNKLWIIVPCSFLLIGGAWWKIARLRNS